MAPGGGLGASQLKDVYEHVWLCLDLTRCYEKGRGFLCEVLVGQAFHQGGRTKQGLERTDSA